MHTLMMDRKRSDFPEYVLHHFLTFTLILFSYVLNYLPIGAVVMILHDVTDLGCSIFKLVVDITPTVVQVIGYLFMIVPWVYFRLWFFPSHVILRIVEELQTWHSYVPANMAMITMLTAFLSLLFCLHVFWFYLMVKGLVKRFKTSFSNGISLSTNENK